MRFSRAIGLLCLSIAVSVGCRSAGDRSPEGGAREAALPAAQQRPGIEPELAHAAATRVGRAHARMRFSRELALEDHRQLHERGFQLLGRLAAGDYLVSFPTPIELGAEPLGSLIVSARRVRPEEKLDPAVERALADSSAADRPLVRVIFFPDLPRREAEAELHRLRLVGEKVGVGPIYELRIDETKLDGLRTSALVMCIQLAPVRATALNDKARAVVRSDQVQQLHQPTASGAAPCYSGYTGAGIKIGICDFGIDVAHPDFADPATGTTRVDPANPKWIDNHGTFVAGFAAGNGAASAAAGWSPFQFRGQAPEAALANYGAFADNPDRYRNARLVDGVHLTQHSLTQSNDAGYRSTAAGIDAIVRGGTIDGAWLPPAPIVWAVGNNGVQKNIGPQAGYYSGLAPAKNPITVGSIDIEGLGLSEFSSLGPTLDGRIKPDLVAPGTHYARHPQETPGNDEGLIGPWAGTQVYARPITSGTSFAAPVVSGIIALMMQAVVDKLQSTPGALHPSTYKVLLVQTAVDCIRASPDPTATPNPDTKEQTLYFTGPDWATGFGLVDAEAAVRLVEQPERWRQGILAATGAVHEYCLDVPEGASALRVSLAWDDPPPLCLDPPTARKLVNDLDLELEDPAGLLHLPLTLPALPPAVDPSSDPHETITSADVVAAQPGIDKLNNVEQALISAPTAGTWRVRVRASTLPLGTVQSYSLAASEAFGDLCFEFVRSPEVWVCKELPWACELSSICTPPLEETGLRFWRGPCVLPFASALEHRLEPFRSVERGWEVPPGWRIELEGLPPSALVIVFDDQGRVLARDAGPGRQRSLRARSTGAGTRLYLAVAEASGAPLRAEARIRVQLHQSP